MKVLFIDDGLVYGGHQLSAVVAAQKLREQGFEVVFAHHSDNARLSGAAAASAADRRRGAGGSTTALHIAPKRLQAVRTILGLGTKEIRNLLARERPDVVVAVQGNILFTTAAVEAARRARVPVVSFIPMATKAKIARIKLIARYHYSRPNAFITTSRTAMRELIAEGAKAPIHLAYYGPDLATLKAQPQVPGPDFTVAIVGRVVFFHKGHDILIRAAARVQRRDLVILVVGDGPDDAALEALAAQLNVRIKRVPWTDDMSSVYAAADLVCLPSRFEGLPLVMLEALHLGIPVIGSDVDGIAEVLPPEWRFPMGDEERLAQMLDHPPQAPFPDIGEMNADAFGRAFAAALTSVMIRR